MHGGHVELDAPLPDGTDVIVVATDEEDPFELDGRQRSELAAGMAALSVATSTQ